MYNEKILTLIRDLIQELQDSDDDMELIACDILKMVAGREPKDYELIRSMINDVLEVADIGDVDDE